MGRSALFVATLLLLAPAFASEATACAVPCGRIYPLILIQVPDAPPSWPIDAGAPLVVDAILTYKFDMMNEGYTVATPNEPIDIRFEFPRKPDWADIQVEPELINVDVANPTYVQPDVSTPTNPQAQYVFTIPITITVTLTGQPILRDGYDYHKLLVFAKSSESGLYQAGYGIKEIRVVPANALHEADVAGTQDVFAVSPLPALALTSGESSFAGTTMTLTPPASPVWWMPGEFVASVSPAPASGTMVFAIHDETGALVASTPPLPAAADVRLNATLVQPGRHVATVTLVPGAGTQTPPMTFAVPFDAGELSAEGYHYPKTYAVSASESVPTPLASTADPLAQFQRDIPFFAFDTAQAVTASLTLKSTTLPVDLGRGTANLQFAIHDPDGNMLVAGTVDPSKPTWSLRVGSLPIDGWYVLRIKGVGTPLGAAYDAYIEVTYAAAHEARARADGIPDATGALLGLGGANLTLPLDGLAVWSPSDVTATVEGADAYRHQITIYDDNGTLAYASGLREGPASFSAPAPGLYRAFVYAEPTLGGLPFSPVVRAFAFPIGAGNVTVASTFSIDDGFEAPLSPIETLLGFHAVRVMPGAAPPTLAGAELVDADGNAAEGTAPGTYYVRASAMSANAEGEEARVTLEQTYASAVTMEGPDVASEPAGGGLRIPGLALALVLVAAGLVAVAVALFRRT